MILGIIPCSKEKIWDVFPEKKAVRADQAYRSAFHLYTRRYAQQHCHRFVILSAKYGLMEPEFVIEGPYDITFSRPSDPYISHEQLALQAQQYQSQESIIVLCPKQYAQRIERAFDGLPPTMHFPLRGIGGFGAMHRYVKNNSIPSQ